MSKRAVSVTLEQENLLWLRGRVLARGHRSLSDALDRLITDARQMGSESGSTVRSIAGTIRIDDRDPELKGADNALRRLFGAALSDKKAAASKRRSKAGRG